MRASLFVGWLFGALVVASSPPASWARPPQADVFVVNSITDLGGNRRDVKLRNLRTKYVHSNTVVADAFIDGLRKGDQVRVADIRSRWASSKTTVTKKDGKKYPSLVNGKECTYYIVGLGTDKVSGWREVENVREELSRDDLKHRSRIPHEKNGRTWEKRDFTPAEAAFDSLTDLRWNWLGSSRSGGRTVEPGGIGDVNVPGVNDFDRAALRHDIQCWLADNFEHSTVVVLRTGAAWNRFTTDALWHHLTVYAEFRTYTRETLNRACSAAKRYGNTEFADEANELSAKSFSLQVLDNIEALEAIFAKPVYRLYMTADEEFPKTLADMARRMSARKRLRDAMADALNVDSTQTPREVVAEVMRKFVAPALDAQDRGSAWERYVLDREGGFDLNSVKMNFPLIDMVSKDGKLVSITFGGPDNWYKKWSLLLDDKKHQQTLDALKANRAKIESLEDWPAGVSIPTTKRQLLQRLQLIVPTEAAAEEVRSKIRLEIAEHRLKKWGEDTYALMKQAWNTDSAIERNLLRMVRGPVR